MKEKNVVNTNSYLKLFDIHYNTSMVQYIVVGFGTKSAQC